MPLAGQSPTPCVHCGHPVTLPVFHVDLFAKVVAGEAHLRQADALWKTMPPAMPLWLPRAVLWGLIGSVFAAVIGWAISGMDLFGGPGRTFAIMVMLPCFVVLQAMLELIAFWSPFARLEASLSALRDPSYPELTLCRRCGAPLTVMSDAVSARCGYCDADNLVRRLRLGAFRRAREVAEVGRAQIDEAIANLRMLRTQRSVVRVVGPAVMVPMLALLLWRLWDQ